MKFSRTYIHLLLAVFAVGLISGCSDSDDPVHKAVVIPAVNPDFDTVASVKKSTTPTGTYEAVAGFSFDSTTKKITLPENAIAAGGNYIKVTGTAEVNGMSDTYTVMTFVADNSKSISANELTTLAVAMVANDDTITTFDDAVEALEGSTGLSNMDITMAMTEDMRAELPNLQAAMNELASNFKASDLTLADLATVTAPNMDMIAYGALLYDNWMTAPAEMPVAGSTTAMDHSGHMGKVTARAEMGHDMTSGPGQNLQTASTTVMLMAGSEHKHLLDEDGAEFEGFNRFARCKECHGWDQMGDVGSHSNRGRSSTTLKSPDNPTTDTGEFIPRPKSIDNTDLTDNTAAYTMMNIVQSNNRYYANVDPASPIMEMTAAMAASKWNEKVNAEDGNGVRYSDMHPDFTRHADADAANTTTPNKGAVNDLVPSHEQVMALTAFLNYDGGKPEHVMTYNSATDAYTLKEQHGSDMDHMIEHGEEYYANYCFRCHGAPDTTESNPLHDYTNMLGYLSNDDDTLNAVRFSSVFHVARWGKAGAYMTRDRIGYPDSHAVANVMAYLKAFQAGDDTTLRAADAVGKVGAGDKVAGEAFYYSKCAGCHAASHTIVEDAQTGAVTPSDSTDTDNAGEDKSYRCHVHADDSVVAADANGECGSNHEVPNLINTHYKMTPNLASISAAMKLANGGNPLTQQEINNLAAFFNSLHDMAM